jgi:acyl-CoA dehydrogenase
MMLMDCLAAGRGISLPATSTGGTHLAARAASAHAAVRVQFGLPIGRFEGIEEPLARLGGASYVLEAARLYTTSGLDAGAKPPVVTAMMKYATTELGRAAINDGMDVCAGNGISRGPNNILAHTYTGMPIGITVEGANILTRTLMVFGQGAIRCHPYAFHEMDAIEKNDVARFDRAFFGHVGHVIRNATRAVLLSLSRGWLARSPVQGPTAPYWRKLAWASASFSLLADVAMGTLGGDLKRKEKITGRFADIFSSMYLLTATLRHFEARGRRKDEVPLMRFAAEDQLARMQRAWEGLMQNLPLPFGGSLLLQGPIALFSRLNRWSAGPSDRDGSKVARLLLTPGDERSGLLHTVFVGTDAARGLARLERAMVLAAEAEPILRKIKDAIRSKTLPRRTPAELVETAQEKGVITAEEGALLARAEEARRDAVEVDSFALDEYLAMGGAGEPEAEHASSGS